MSEIAEAFVRKVWAAEFFREISKERSNTNTVRVSAWSARDEQIWLLAQQLFFRSPEPPFRHVAFATAEPDNESAELCLAVAQAVAEAGHKVGLIDAAANSSPLETRIGELEGGKYKERDSEKRLRLVPRREWSDQDRDRAVSPASLIRLHGLSRQFDFSILCCGSMSLLATTIARTCDGLVLILAANRTRRVVAESMKEQLRTAGVPLLGTVLAGRRFPIPMGLYRKL